MSRNTIYNDNRLTVIHGIDHVIGEFYQIFDNEMVDETQEGEGLVFDWSQKFGFEVNITGQPNQVNVLEIIINYVSEFKS